MNKYHTDINSLLSRMKNEDKLLKSKRRWLLGLPFSSSKHDAAEEPEFLNSRCLPESFLRKDDVFYENCRERVEEEFKEQSAKLDGEIVQNSMAAVETSKVIRLLISRLDDFSNKGLLLLANTLIPGSIEFEKTRPKMKKLVNEYLSRMLKDQRQHYSQTALFSKLFQILNNLTLLQAHSMASFALSSHSHRAAAHKILDILDDFPLQTLIAMNRRLRGEKGKIPQLRVKMPGFNREIMINRVRSTCEKMLREGGDDLPESLAKAMAVARLSLLLSGDFRCSDIPEFCVFSPPIARLQNEVMKAIWLVNEKVGRQEIKELKLLFDPNGEKPTGRICFAIRRMLIEYLFECSDIDSDSQQDYLSRALAIIHRYSPSVPWRNFPKEEMDAEVECILSVSAQGKQILLDLLPEHEFDEEFNDAYMEDLVENEENSYEDNFDYPPALNNFLNRFHSEDFNESVESMGETSAQHEASGMSKSQLRNESLDLNQNQVNSIVGSYASVSRTNSRKLCDDSLSVQEVKPYILMDSARSQIPFFSSLSGYTSSIACKRSSRRNHYLSMQEVCDTTSMVAYNLIDRVLDEYANVGGLSLDLNEESYCGGTCSSPEDPKVKRRKSSASPEDMGNMFILQLVEELLPSFPESGKERLKQLLSLQ